MHSNTLNILRLSLIFTVVTTATAAVSYKFTPDKNLGVSIRVAVRSESSKTLEWQYLKVNTLSIGPTLDRRDTFGDGVHTGVWLSGDTKSVLIYFAAATEREGPCFYS